MIYRSTADVYHAAGRRWLTLKAASVAAARKAVRESLNRRGDDWREADPAWYGVRVQRLAGLYRARYRRDGNPAMDQPAPKPSKRAESLRAMIMRIGEEV